MEQTSGCPGLRKGSGQKESRCCCKRTAWGSLVWTDRDVLCLKCISINILAVTLECGKMLLDLPCSSDGKESACNAGDLGSIPGSGRSPGEGNGDLENSGLENCMDCIVHGIAKSWTQLSDFHSLIQPSSKTNVSLKYIQLYPEVSCITRHSRPAPQGIHAPGLKKYSLGRTLPLSNDFTLLSHTNFFFFA